MRKRKAVTAIALSVTAAVLCQTLSACAVPGSAPESAATADSGLLSAAAVTEAAPTEADTAWKTLYTDFLDSLDRSEYAGFQLLFIDADDVPELYAQPNNQRAPGYLCWVSDGVLCRDVTQTELYYFERRNSYRIRSVYGDTGWDHVRRIDGEESQESARGEMCTAKGKEYYRWNGEEVPHAEYDRRLKAAFDTDAAQKPDSLKSFVEIRVQVHNY